MVSWYLLLHSLRRSQPCWKGVHGGGRDGRAVDDGGAASDLDNGGEDGEGVDIGEDGEGGDISKGGEGGESGEGGEGDGGGKSGEGGEGEKDGVVIEGVVVDMADDAIGSEGDDHGEDKPELWKMLLSR